MKTSLTLYRQGDVLITPVDQIPAGLTPTNQVILAYGEKTGHSHQIKSGAKGYGAKADGPCSYLEIAEALAELHHDEHAPVALPPGKYSVRIQREYHPEAIRNVAD